MEWKQNIRSEMSAHTCEMLESQILKNYMDVIVNLMNNQTFEKIKSLIGLLFVIIFFNVLRMSGLFAK